MTALLLGLLTVLWEGGKGKPRWNIEMQGSDDTRRTAGPIIIVENNMAVS